MTYDTIAVLIIVSCAAIFVLRRAWKTMRASKGPDDGCDGCGH